MIYLSPPHLNPEANFYLQKAIETNWVAPVGENLDEFEKSVCQYTQSKYALATSSGTSAIHLALRLLGVQANDMVICPSLTFVATANPIFYQNATPILVDSELDSWNICPKYLALALDYCKRHRKRVGAIIVVHLYGQPAKMKEINEIAQYYQVPIVEDSAEALGSKYGKPNEEKYAGTLGALGVFSFNGNKIITTSGGGMLLTHTRKAREKALFWATQAKDEADYYHHSEIGYNYRLSNVLAGIGRGQMEVLGERVLKKREIFDFYKKNITQLFTQFQPELPNSYSNHWLTAVLFENENIRNKLLQRLQQHNIEARHFWTPLHTLPLFKDVMFFGEKINRNIYKNIPQSIAEDLFSRGLCLPSGTALSAEDLTMITDLINEFGIETWKGKIG